MRTSRKNEIVFAVVLYPMLYCFVGLLLTALLRKHVCSFMINLLYLEDEHSDGNIQPESELQPVGQDLLEDMDEFTLDDSEDVREAERQIVPPKLKTIDFKKPEFMKKMTNSYFKRSKKGEGALIMQKELTSQKLHFNLHKKNSKSQADSGN